MIFSERIKQLRILNKLTQLEISERLNMDQSTYSRYEKGVTTPTADIIVRIAMEFEVSTDWLLGNEKNKNTL